jgi:ABC-2 type transport system ATP-binding protein
VHDEIAAGREVLAAFGRSGAVTVEEHTRRLTVPVTGGAKLLAEVIRELDARGVEIDDIGLRRPTLDDVFISLTGHAAEQKDTPDAPDATGATAASRKDPLK